MLLPLGVVSKSLSEAKALKSAEQIKNVLATGVAPDKSISLKEIRILMGLEAGDETGLLPQTEGQ